jgi:hypothetical protein
MTDEIIKMSPSVYVVNGTSLSWGSTADKRLCSCAAFKAAKACDHMTALAAHLGVELAEPTAAPTSNALDGEILRFQNTYVHTLREAAGGKV